MQQTRIDLDLDVTVEAVMCPVIIIEYPDSKLGANRYKSRSPRGVFNDENRRLSSVKRDGLGVIRPFTLSF